jgi:hypothetical protein
MAKMVMAQLEAVAVEVQSLQEVVIAAQEHPQLKQPVRGRFIGETKEEI